MCDCGFETDWCIVGFTAAEDFEGITQSATIHLSFEAVEHLLRDLNSAKRVINTFRVARIIMKELAVGPMLSLWVMLLMRFEHTAYLVMVHPIKLTVLRNMNQEPYFENEW